MLASKVKQLVGDDEAKLAAFPPLPDNNTFLHFCWEKTYKPVAPDEVGRAKPAAVAEPLVPKIMGYDHQGNPISTHET